ncbi:MAG: DHHA1 domain-containing protein [Planctomycetota bacterium]|jgi:alanyl-tRNA synthetase
MLSKKLFTCYNPVVERLYWTNPDVYETEVEAKSIGDCRVTIDPIVFHPDEGGQPPDKGTIDKADVLNVEIVEGQIVHTLDKPLNNGRYIARVDKKHRLHTASQHTAQHIISGIAQTQFALKTVGVHIGFERCTVDFDKKVDWETAGTIEQGTMEVITENIPVETVFNDTDVRSRFDLTEIESDKIRVVKIGKYDASACCGTHVRRTGDIGIVRIIDLENKKEGTRISFVAGRKALEFSQTETFTLRELRKLSKCSTPELPVILQKALDQSKSLNKEVDRLQGLILPSLAESAKVIEIGSSKIGIQVNAVSSKYAAKLAALIANEIDGTGIVTSDGNIVINSRNLNANDLLKKLQKAIGGKGGGSSKTASGKLDNIVTTDQVIRIIQEQ